MCKIHFKTFWQSPKILEIPQDLADMRHQNTIFVFGPGKAFDKINWKALLLKHRKP
jgi:hypothetical protein